MSPPGCYTGPSLAGKRPCTLRGGGVPRSPAGVYAGARPLHVQAMPGRPARGGGRPAATGFQPLRGPVRRPRRSLAYHAGFRSLAHPCRPSGGWHAGARPGPPGATARARRCCQHGVGAARTGRPTAAVTAPGGGSTASAPAEGGTASYRCGRPRQRELSGGAPGATPGRTRVPTRAHGGKDDGAIDGPRAPGPGDDP